MIAAAFRRLALSFEGAVEQAHLGHPDFRAHGRIFASLGYPDDGHAMVSLTPEQQAGFIRDHPGVFHPAAGAWGRQGSTMVRLEAGDEETVGAALTEAFRKVKARDRKPARPGPRQAPKARARSSRGR